MICGDLWCVPLQPVRAASAAVAVPEDRAAAAAALQTILGIAVKLSDVGADPSAAMPASTATVVDVPLAANGDISEGSGSRAIRNALTRTRMVGSQALAGLCAAFQRGLGVSGVDQAFVDFWLDRCGYWCCQWRALLAARVARVHLVDTRLHYPALPLHLSGWTHHEPQCDALTSMCNVCFCRRVCARRVHGRLYAPRTWHNRVIGQRRL